MCRNELKNKIRDAIANGDSENGWRPSQLTYANRAYTDVFKKNYPQSDTVARATIALSLDSNGDIRCYPHLAFREIRVNDWRSKFYEQFRNETIEGIALRSAEYNRPARTGIAINAILENQSWVNWKKTFPADAISTLKECCLRLSEWTDKYVASLP